LDNDKVQNFRVMVQLTKKKCIEKVISLLEEDRAREAFELLVTKGEVLDYLPRGRKPQGRAEITLFEDML